MTSLCQFGIILFDDNTNLKKRMRMAKQFKDSYEYARVKSQRPDLSARVQRQEANTEFLLEGSGKYNPNTRNMSKVVREEVINGKRYMVISTN